MMSMLTMSTVVTMVTMVTMVTAVSQRSFIGRSVETPKTLSDPLPLSPLSSRPRPPPPLTMTRAASKSTASRATRIHVAGQGGEREAEGTNISPVAAPTSPHLPSPFVARRLTYSKRNVD